MPSQHIHRHAALLTLARGIVRSPPPPLDPDFTVEKNEQGTQTNTTTPLLWCQCEEWKSSTNRVADGGCPTYWPLTDGGAIGGNWTAGFPCPLVRTALAAAYIPRRGKLATDKNWNGKIWHSFGI